MGWLVFGIAAWLAALLIVPLKKWKKAWPVGIAGMLIIYYIDSSLRKLGAFEFNQTEKTVSGLPIPYWLSYFPGGILFEHFRPIGRWERLIYIFIASSFLLFLEWLMIKLGYFEHLNWSLLRAFILDLGGFTILLWIAEWLEPPKSP